MKTSNIISALRNATSPAASLAAWQNRHVTLNLTTIRGRLAKPYYSTESVASARQSIISSTGPELSAPETEKPLLWLSGERDPEILDCFAGRKFLDHRGWYADEFQDETIETYAVRLKRFPRLLFYGVMSYGGLRVDLSEWEEIDFSNAFSESYGEDLIRETAKDVIRSNDSSTEREAEESREFCRKDQAERDIAENKETLATLRQEIRALCGELKQLCQSSMSDLYPVSAKGVREHLKALLRDRREIIATNEELSASL